MTIAESVRMLTVDEVKERLGLTRQTAYRYVEKGIIPGIKIGTLWRVREDVIDQIVESGQPKN